MNLILERTAHLAHPCPKHPKGKKTVPGPVSGLSGNFPANLFSRFWVGVVSVFVKPHLITVAVSFLSGWLWCVIGWIYYVTSVT